MSHQPPSSRRDGAGKKGRVLVLEPDEAVLISLSRELQARHLAEKQQQRDQSTADAELLNSNARTPTLPCWSGDSARGSASADYSAQPCRQTPSASSPSIVLREPCAETGKSTLVQLVWQDGQLVRRRYSPPQRPQPAMTSEELSQRLAALVDIGDGSAIIDGRRASANADISDQQRTMPASASSSSSWRDQPTLRFLCEAEKDVLDASCEAEIASGSWAQRQPAARCESGLSVANLRCLDAHSADVALEATDAEDPPTLPSGGRLNPHSRTAVAVAAAATDGPSRAEAFAGWLQAQGADNCRTINDGTTTTTTASPHT